MTAYGHPITFGLSLCPMNRMSARLDLGDHDPLAQEG